MVSLEHESVSGQLLMLALSGLVSVDGDTASKLEDFTSLSSQIAAVTPSGVQMDQYTPTNTVPSSCPTVGSTWQAASALPPTPDPELCACMAKAVECTPSESLSDEGVGELFGIVCGLPGDPCAGVAASPANGTYGTYGMCEGREQLAFVLNQYNLQQQAAGNQDGCNFSGSASRQSPAAQTGACSSKINAAGNGTIPTGSSGSSSTSSSQGAAAGGMTHASLNIGSLQVGIYVICAIFSGAGMILL
jgi:1,3-beta-glucanosyltransferase GAS1